MHFVRIALQGMIIFPYLYSTNFLREKAFISCFINFIYLLVAILHNHAYMYMHGFVWVFIFSN